MTIQVFDYSQYIRNVRFIQTVETGDVSIYDAGAATTGGSLQQQLKQIEADAAHRYFASGVAAWADSPGFMNLTSTRWPMRKGVLSAETTTSTTRSSLA